MEPWTIAKSTELYRIDGWGANFFSINENGNVSVKPNSDRPAIDLHKVVEDLVRRGVKPPLLMRFDGIIRERAHTIYDSFDKAMAECDYKGKYVLTYPVKVNQQRQVVESVKMAANGRGIGLEVGSKPELLAVLSVHNAQRGLLLCNGYKDYQFIELALMSSKLGLRPIITVEQFYELETILRASEAIGVVPEIGLRMNPSSRGAGRWAGSAGENAKFGLALYEILEAIKQLKARGMEHYVKLLHFHIGSQITSINAIKKAMKEASRVFVEIARLCPSIEFLDVGGGLGVDYDGSCTNFESSMNYTTDQYARDVVWEITAACNEVDIPHPTIISESGRALVAHHALLVTEVMDVAEVPEPPDSLETPPSDDPQLKELTHLYRDLSLKNCHEVFSDAASMREEFLQRFMQGNITLEERAYADRSLKHLFTRINTLKKKLKHIPEDFELLEGMLKDTYFCNFSVFQSILDHWAIEQLFPIMPIHRLAQEPTRRAVIADLTCDSDGKIDKFIDLRGVQRHIDLHPYRGDQPYYLGTFLIGAYQECLGNLHNLFGDTNAVHIEVDEDGLPRITSIVEGDTIREVLGYVQYTGDELIYGINNSIERAVRNNTMSAEESARFMRCYKESLSGYTYLLWETPASQFSGIANGASEPITSVTAAPSSPALARTA
jgi:arginine decarboxylase